MTQVLALCGSLRAGSKTRKALDVAVEGATKAGGSVTLLSLGECRLPLFEEGVTEKDPAVIGFKEKVRGCDALLIATPVYHDSYSGSVKNALDHLYSELLDKMVALIAVGGGRSGLGQALEHLRAVLRETGSWVIPRQAQVASADQAFDEAGALRDRELHARLSSLGEELVLRTKLMRTRRAPPKP